VLTANRSENRNDMHAPCHRVSCEHWLISRGHKHFVRDARRVPDHFRQAAENDCSSYSVRSAGTIVTVNFVDPEFLSQQDGTGPSPCPDSIPTLQGNRDRQRWNPSVRLSGSAFCETFGFMINMVQSRYSMVCRATALSRPAFQSTSGL